jgi:hypothetical protein
MALHTACRWRRWAPVGLRVLEGEAPSRPAVGLRAVAKPPTRPCKGVVAPGACIAALIVLGE